MSNLSALNDPRLFPERFTVCANPQCMRIVKRGCRYCCGQCTTGAEHTEGGGPAHEPHHTASCDERHAERGDAPESWRYFPEY